MQLKNQKYIILELIPTTQHPETGDIIQLSALKVDGLQILDRFDYRLNEDLILIKDFLDIISYDKDSFTYKNSTKDIISDFKSWTNGLPLLILDNQYTQNYLDELDNLKEPITKYLHLSYHDNIIDEIINKYNLEPSNYIVDLLYEALIHEI